MQKRCPACKTIKDAAEFYHASNRSDGLSVQCRSCSLAAGKASIQKLRRNALDHLGGACKACGYNDERALVIDHVDGNGAKERKAGLTGRALYYAVLSDTEGKYQLLCANCNTIKRIEMKEHGARAYVRRIPEGRPAADRRSSPERRAAVSEQSRRRWVEDPEYRENTRKAQSEAMKRRWASGEVPNRRRKSTE